MFILFRVSSWASMFSVIPTICFGFQVSFLAFIQQTTWLFKKKRNYFTEYHHCSPQMRGSQVVFALTLIFKVRSDAKHEKWCIFEVSFICQRWGIVKNVIKVHRHSRRAQNYSVSAARGWLITMREWREEGNGDMKRAVQRGNRWEMS